MSDIVLESVSKSYDGKKVLDNISLSFKEGKTTCIKGASGCGKTTLLRIIAGLIEKDSGSIRGLPERISYVFQEDRLCEDFSAVSNIMAVTGRKLPREAALQHLAELGLAESALKPVRELSGGMKRRVAIARAVCYESGLIILDEPFKGLDVKLRRNVMDYIKRHGDGRTIICVTHDPEEADYMGGELIDMEEEKV
ncbi:MAG: ATP-binding cassette domain-containing protein [Treponemataceae bacterium]|nr:ATP-binding cassette domain-containing protein [Treponemataceae bacterium]